ncbi:MAG: hypothetical protein ACI9R3_002368 [Verrucomicrobiales bacterium]
MRIKLTSLLFLAALLSSASADIDPEIQSGTVPERKVSFEDDVIPVLTRSGCNSGGCHGKVAGQNGFRLSLRGYAPIDDYWSLTGEFRGRRLNQGFPESSLLLLKATNRTPHEGGALFAEDSRAFATLARWIREGSPGPDAAPLPDTVSAAPEHVTMQPGESVQLRIDASYPGGRQRDVTWLAKFYSNDPSTVSVDDNGSITALRAGEATVRAHFRGQVALATLTIPYSGEVDSDRYGGAETMIDRAVFTKLKSLRIPPSPDCSDTAFLRRAFLDATGRLPDEAATRAFLEDSSPNKRTELVAMLVESEAFNDYWTLQLADLLQNRKERDHDVRGSKGVRAFHAWLRGKVAANEPWDAIARQVLLATGSVADQPQVGYYVTTLGEKRKAEESEVPDAVAQAFLGTRIGCARCHNHPLEKFTQDDFYHFAAFFARTSLKRVSPSEGYTELVVATEDESRIMKDLKKSQDESAVADNGKKEELARRIADLEKQLTERRSKPPTARQPRTNEQLTAAPLDRQQFDFPPGGDPRVLFADWLTTSAKDKFAGAMVNRLWRHFMGVGLVEPVDDLRDSNPPTNRELWDGLTNAFIESEYDLRALVRLIMESRTYQLSSTTTGVNATDAKFYSHYYARRLPAEVLLDALCDVTGVPENFEGYPAGLRAVQVPDPSVKSYFLELFGRSERVTACACERSGDVTLPQLLHLYNGSVQEKIGHDEGNVAGWISKGHTDDAIVDRLYRVAFCRAPKPEETASITAYLQDAADRTVALRDVVWAVLNTKEFSFNH